MTASITITSPALDDRRIVGVEESITWNSNDVIGPVDIALSLNGTSYPVTLAAGTTNDGEFAWTPLQDHVTPTARIRVRDSNLGIVVDESDLFKVATTVVTSGATPIDLSTSPPDRQIAGRMADLVSGEPQFAGMTVAQIINPKRELKSMTEGEVLIDMLGVGMRSVAQNRRNFAREYVTHAAIRCKLDAATVTADILDELGAIATGVQTYFENAKSIQLDDETRASLIMAVPFVHADRESLFGSGLFLSPIEFTWKLHRS